MFRRTVTLQRAGFAGFTGAAGLNLKPRLVVNVRVFVLSAAVWPWHVSCSLDAAENTGDLPIMHFSRRGEKKSCCNNTTSPFKRLPQSQPSIYTSITPSIFPPFTPPSFLTRHGGEGVILRGRTRGEEERGKVKRRGRWKEERRAYDSSWDRREGRMGGGEDAAERGGGLPRLNQISSVSPGNMCLFKRASE